MILRDISAEFHALLSEYPVVTVLGPRQAGKTTLVRAELPEFEYCNLEHPETRNLATEDPKALLATYSQPTIFDEIQRAPELLSYIQVKVDEDQRNGRYVLTGSSQFEIHQAITQSLAGRTAILTLFPLSIEELIHHGQQSSAWEYAYMGFLPRVHSRNQRPSTAYANYYQTYVERDVRQLVNVRDMSLFERFIRLLAGRVGQCMDKSSLAGDVGTSPRTIANWLSILEASFLLYRLPPYFKNFGKRVIKSPKYYFIDTGLLCYLLGIRSPEQAARDPLVGAIFENLVVGEIIKAQANRGIRPEIYFFRDSNGAEVDLLIPRGSGFDAVEIKSAATYRQSLLKSLNRIESLTPEVASRYLIYRGERRSFSNGIKALPFEETASVVEARSDLPLFHGTGVMTGVDLSNTSSLLDLTEQDNGPA